MSAGTVADATADSTGRAAGTTVVDDPNGGTRPSLPGVEELDGYITTPTCAGRGCLTSIEEGVIAIETPAGWFLEQGAISELSSSELVVGIVASLAKVKNHG